MISYDDKAKQVLTDTCLACPDKHFQPAIADLPRVGCCSYSPTFQLFELYKMIIHDEPFFFSLLTLPNSTIYPFEIKVAATVHPLFYKEDVSILPTLEKDDRQTAYSVCYFFRTNQGCSLSPSFKNATCRSFICSTVEESLTQLEKKKLTNWVTDIQAEANTFYQKHKLELERLNITLRKNPKEVVEYFKLL